MSHRQRQHKDVEEDEEDAFASATESDPESEESAKSPQTGAADRDATPNTETSGMRLDEETTPAPATQSFFIGDETSDPDDEEKSFCGAGDDAGAAGSNGNPDDREVFAEGDGNIQLLIARSCEGDGEVDGELDTPRAQEERDAGQDRDKAARTEPKASQVPRNSRYFMHDDREDDAEVDEKENGAEERLGGLVSTAARGKSEKLPKATGHPNDKKVSRGQQKARTADDGPWLHDKFDEILAENKATPRSRGNWRVVNDGRPAGRGNGSGNWSSQGWNDGKAWDSWRGDAWKDNGRHNDDDRKHGWSRGWRDNGSWEESNGGPVSGGGQKADGGKQSSRRGHRQKEMR